MDKQQTSLKELTVGQVFDTLTPDMVAMSTHSDEYMSFVNKHKPKIWHKGGTMVTVNTAIHINLKTNVLEYYNGNTIYLGYSGPDGHYSKFILVPREEYEVLVSKKSNDEEGV